MPERYLNACAAAVSRSQPFRVLWVEVSQSDTRRIAVSNLAGTPRQAHELREYFAPSPLLNHKTIMQTIIQRDTKAWTVQVWISFLIAVFLCATGLAYLPGQDIDRAFMIMGYLFCLTATFGLSKFVRDNASKKADTPMWRWVVFGGFAVAMALTAWGLWRMNINETYKVFLLVSWLYLITCTFTLAKTLRDRHDADVAEARLSSDR
jgi:hypothetical protein